MKKYLLLVTLSLIITKLPAQQTTSEEPTGISDQKIVINHEMIKRFNDFKADGDIYSWSQLLIKTDHSSILDFISAYTECDFENQSLESIKLALEQKTGNNKIEFEQWENSYYAAINRIKQEINEKLKSGLPVAMK